MLGPLALSMAGMICLAPAAAKLLAGVITPVYRAIGQDPAMFGSFLAIDMGGYQMAVSLADNELAGRFSGILVSACFGCTITFTIPTGMGILPEQDRQDFAWGTMYGLIAMPVGLFFGALLCGIGALAAVTLCAPLALLSVLLALAVIKWPRQAERAFRVLAAALRVIATLGLTLGAFQYISGVTLIDSVTSLDEAMRTVSAICIMLLGSLPLAELLQRLLRKPLSSLGTRLGVGADGLMGVLIFYLNVTPGLASLHGMNCRGRRLCAAFAVCGASCLTAHLAFTLECEPQLALPLILTKLIGGLLGAVLAYLCTANQKRPQA